MAHIDIIIGSTLGAAEYVAEHLAQQLQAKDHDTILHYQASLETLKAKQQPNAIWLIVSSTHGAGQVPDNLQPFSEQLSKQPPQQT